MKALSMLQFLSYVVLISTLLASPPVTTAAGLALRADLTHVDSGRGFTKGELLQRMVARTTARAVTLRSPRRHAGAAAAAPVGPGTVGDVQTEYLVHLGVGTPRPQHVALTLDTGSDLVWTQCKSCTVCFDQPFPAFNPSASTTVKPVPCSDRICGGLAIPGCIKQLDACFFFYDYGDKSITAGQIIKDTFTFKAPNANGAGSTVAVPDLGFGCGMFNIGLFGTNESGIAGFGRGPLSLPSQLKVGKFSYCFTTMFKSKSSAVFLGSPKPDDLKTHATGPILSTPMKRNPDNPTFYYLSLKGISIGEKRLPVPESAFAIKSDGSGGTFIDSGTAITRLPKAVFGHLRSAFVSQMPLPVLASEDFGDSILCFDALSAANAKKVPVPRLVFHLEGADWDLPRDNYMVVDGDGAGSRLCVVIVAAAEGDESTNIGNFQQQNMHIVYDLEKNKLLFAPAQCDKL